MQIKAENRLNPYKYRLSEVVKKRLRWLYILYYEPDGNVTTSANKIGISREWLSNLKVNFENSENDPRNLKPKSKAPKRTDKRKSIE